MSGVYNVYPNVHASLDDTEEEERQNLTKKYIPDTYLDSPVLVNSRTRWLTALVTGNPGTKDKMFIRNFRLVSSLLPDILDYVIVDPDEYPSLYRYPWPSTIDDELTEAWETAADVMSSVYSALQNRTAIHPPGLRAELSPHSIPWYNGWSYFDSLVEEFSRINVASGTEVISMKVSSHTEVIACRDVWFLHYKPEKKKMLLTYDQVLMIKDVLYSRAQVYTAAEVFFPHDKTILVAIDGTCKWHELCLLRYGNPGFELLKQTEALSKAYLSQMTDPMFGDDGSYPRMLAKVLKKEEDLIRDPAKRTVDNMITPMFDQILRACKDVQTVVEIFGLLKISGHPLVDPMVGGASAAAEAQSPDHTLYHDAECLNWEFKRNMLENYIRVEGKWPPLHFSPKGSKTTLRKLCSKQTRRLTRNSYPASDWRHCEFGQIVDFDYSPNYLDLIDDRSISLYRTNIAAFWDYDVPAKSHRRLLIELINRDTVDIPAIVQAIATRQVPFDWLIVSLHPKEREFKLAPRMFSMLVFEIRIFFALTEANIADKIFPYLPQQTMTKNRQAIATQFLEMTQPITDDEILRMFVEIDLSRWNLRWRPLAINMIGRTLNDMFGMPGVFDYCHEFFRSALIIVRVPGLRPDGIELPDPPNSELVWRNHLGGFEGICQKLWTIATYSMVSVAIADLPLSYILLGQGDNQILSLRTVRRAGQTASQTLIELRDEVLTRIEARCASVNQEVKPSECLESTTVITYSKDVYVNGVYRPTTLKFHSRLFPHSSQVFPSLRTNIGAIFSTAMAGAEKSVDPMKSYMLAIFHSALYMNRISKRRGPYGVQVHQVRSALKHKWHDFVKFTLMLPSECGGYPTIPPVGFMYKGGSDPLGKSVSSMVLLGEHSGSRLYNRMLAQLSAASLFNPSPKLVSLFMDPFSAPFEKPPTAVDGVANETVTALTAHVRTKDISQLLSNDTRDYVDKLVEALAACRPMNPLIIRDMLDCSVAGITDTISRMFVATRTLQEVVRCMGLPILDRVLHLESSGFLYMYHRFCRLPNDPAKKKTAYQLTNELRSRWFPGQPCPIVGLTTYQPMDFPVIWDVRPAEIEGVNAVLVAESDPLNTRGPYQPYTGSMTREKRSEHGFKIVGTDGASKAMRKLQLISSQTGDDESFHKLIDVIGWSRTNTQLSAVSHLLPGVAGGNMIHRYSARAGHLAAWNVGSPNFATHCVVSTDNTGKLAGGVEDYPLMFQEFILTALWMIQQKHTTEGGKYASVTIRTNALNIDPLPDVSITGPDSFVLPVMRFPDNPLTFLPSLKLEQVAGAIQHPSLPVESTAIPSRTLMMHTLEGYYKDALRSRSAGRMIADGARVLFQTKTLDIAEVKACGFSNIITAIANICADAAISDFIMTDARNYSRWRVGVYASKLVSPLVQTISPHIGHPLLNSDPVIRQFMLHDHPAYAGGYVRAHERLCGIVSNKIKERLYGYHPHYSHRSVALFTSSAGRATSDVLLTCILVDLYLWRLRGDLSEKTVNNLIRKQIIPYIRKTHSENDRVTTLFRMIMNMHAIFLRRHKYTVCEVLDQYRLGRRVKAYKMTVLDLLKSFRKVVFPIDAQIVVYKQPDLRLPTTAPKPRIYTRLEWSSLQPGVRELNDQSRSGLELLREVFLRNRKRYSYAVGTSLYYWMTFAPLIPTSEAVIVIGSGYGSAARVALDLGCPSVAGLDLRTSIPMKAHRFIAYKPLLIRASEHQERYLQMPESYTTSGNWLEESVVARSLLYDTGRSTLIIDIEAGRHRYGLELLIHVFPRKRHGRILMRLFLSHDELIAVSCDLKASGVEFFEFDEGKIETSARLFLIYKWRSKLLVTGLPRGDTIASPVPLLPASSQDVNLTHRALALSDALLNVVSAGPDQSLADMQEEIDQMIIDSFGNYDSRFSYREWTRYLHARVCVEWIQLTEGQAWDKIVEWAESRTITLRVRGRQLTVKADQPLLRHLASYGSRILGT